jgi:hypothetical protein
MNRDAVVVIFDLIVKFEEETKKTVSADRHE